MVDNIKSIARPDLTTVLDGQKRVTQKSINCHQIGTIQSFDKGTQLANIKISMKQVVSVAEDGTETYQDYPLLMECPVIVLFGGVDVLTLPVEVGDNCLVFFNDREIDNWLNNGDGTYPVTARLHDISDAFAIVGIRPLTNSITNYLANGIRLSHGIGNSQIDLTDDLIESIAELFLHNGNMQVTGDVLIEGDTEINGDERVDQNVSIGGNLTIEGETYGNGGELPIQANVRIQAGYELESPEVHVGNGATGTFTVVTVEDGIVISGS